MNYKAIIFDMDGTIVDTNSIWKQAVRDLITARSIPLSCQLEDYLQTELQGLYLEKSCAFLKDYFKLEEPNELLVKEKSARAASLYQEKVSFIDGFQAFYKQVQSYDLKTAIATNADDHTTEITRKALSLDAYFGHHIYPISHVHNQGKPNPAIYLFAAQQLDVTPAECIAIEDSHHGVHAAKNAGMYTIGINTNKQPERIAHADIVIQGYDEINLAQLLQIH